MGGIIEEFVPSLPLRIELEILSVCNKNCGYCYAKPFTGELTPFSTLKYIINKTENEVKPFDVVFLGGEPFIRKDIIEILQVSYSTFSTRSISVSTNGTLFKTLEKEQLMALRELSKTFPMIQVSIDSLNNAKLDKSAESFEGIKLLQANDIPFKIGIVLMKDNYNDYLDTIKTLTSFSFLRGINLEPLQKTSDEYFIEKALTNIQLIQARLEVGKLVREARRDIHISGIFDLPDTLLAEKLLRREKTGMELQNKSIAIAGIYVNGDVSTNGALGRKTIIGNVLRQSWTEIWNNARTSYLKERRAKSVALGI